LQFSSNGNPNIMSIAGNASPGSEVDYNIGYSSSPGSQIIVTTAAPTPTPTPTPKHHKHERHEGDHHDGDRIHHPENYELAAASIPF
jgi:hypothetical protein